jgi:hypothetical protein
MANLGKDWANDVLDPCKAFEVPTESGFLHIAVIGIGDAMRIEVNEFIKNPDFNEPMKVKKVA